MFNQITIAICAVLCMSVTSVRCLLNDVNVTDITVVNASNRFQTYYPKAKLEDFNKVKLIKGNYCYTVGNRIPGDKLISEVIDKQSFPSAKDIQVVVRYPGRGTGYTLTHIEVIADQTGDMGASYLFDGGIDKKFANILVEANGTLHFSYSCALYGY